MRPATAASWFPSRVTSAMRRTASQHSLGLAPYPTTSPRHTTRSTWRERSVRSTSWRASRFEWTSLMTAIFIAAPPGGTAPAPPECGAHYRRPSSKSTPRHQHVQLQIVEVGEPAELGVSGPDLPCPDLAQPVQAELLHREAGDDAPHHHGAPHGGHVQAAGPAEVPHEAA